MSNAEARSWWADVQHLRPDAATGSAVLARPEPADATPGGDPLPAPAPGDPLPAPAPGDPLLAPAPGRRFVRTRPEDRAEASPVEPGPPLVQRPADREHPVDRERLSDGQRPADGVRASGRRIVLLRDDEPFDTASRRGARSAHDGLARPTTAGDARSAGPSTVDVDFDFGRAAEDRARRRTAQRLGSSGTSARSKATTTAMGGHTDATSAAPAPTGAGAPGSPAGRAGHGADLAPVPLAPPPARHRLLGRAGRGAAAPARRPRRPRGHGLASQPDRIALWAVVLGILLIALAAASSRADAATHAALQSPAALEQAVAAGTGAPARADAAAGPTAR